MQRGTYTRAHYVWPLNSIYLFSFYWILSQRLHLEVLGYTQSGTDTGSNEKKQINTSATQDAIPRAMCALFAFPSTGSRAPAVHALSPLSLGVAKLPDSCHYHVILSFTIPSLLPTVTKVNDVWLLKGITIFRMCSNPPLREDVSWFWLWQTHFQPCLYQTDVSRPTYGVDP